MTEVNEQQPEPESELDPDVIDELADDDAPVDMRTLRRMRSEAKKLRHRLREAESNRAAAEEARAGDLARLAAMEKREIEHAAAEVLIDAEDIWRHTDAETQKAFIDSEFGEIARDPIIEAAKRLAAERPHLARRDVGPPPSNRPVEGLRPGATPETKAAPAPSWATALRGSGA